MTRVVLDEASGMVEGVPGQGGRGPVRYGRTMPGSARLALTRPDTR
jgi:hypothetical protein